MKPNLTKLIAGLSDEEQLALAKGIRGRHRTLKLYDHQFSGNHMKFGYYSDPHVGEKHFLEAEWLRMIAFFKKEKIDVVYCPGDNLEGMSGRPGHIYELTHIGASAQLKYASDLFHVADGIHFFIIDGNHDQWFKEKGNSGLVTGEELQVRNPNVTFLGEWEADVVLSKGVRMKLFHSNDGTAYADSYKIQKLIESLESNSDELVTDGIEHLPNIILSGHYHKHLVTYKRHIFGIECGTLCSQTRFMRGKKLAAAKGWGVIDVWFKKGGGIERLQHEWLPAHG